MRENLGDGEMRGLAACCTFKCTLDREAAAARGIQRTCRHGPEQAIAWSIAISV